MIGEVLKNVPTKTRLAVAGGILAATAAGVGCLIEGEHAQATYQHCLQQWPDCNLYQYGATTADSHGGVGMGVLLEGVNPGDGWKAASYGLFAAAGGVLGGAVLVGVSEAAGRRQQVAT